MASVIDRREPAPIPGPEGGIGPVPLAPPRRRNGGGPTAVLLLVPLVAVAFFPCIFNDFAHVDDWANFKNNRSFLGAGPRQFSWAWRTMLLGVYQPVSWMCLSVQSAFWGLDPRGYHAASLALHALNAVVLCRLTARLLRECSPEFEGGHPGTVSIAVAVALYAVHPLRVEAVAWASCQPYLLCGLFGLLSVSSYLSAHGRVDRSSRPALALFGSYLLYWAALLSKAPAVSLPALLLVLDVYPLRRFEGVGRSWPRELRRSLVEKLPYLALAIPFMYFTRRVRGLSAGDVPPSFTGIPSRLAHACYSAWFYPLKTVWPSDLICHYEIPGWARPTAPVFLAAAAAVASASLGIFLMRSRWPGLLAAWVSYLIVLAPTSGLTPFGSNITADRYSYLSMMCWVPPVAACFAMATRMRGAAKAGLAALGLAGSLSTLSLLSREQSRTWHDDVTLLRYALAHGMQGAWAHNNLGVSLTMQGDTEGALAHFDESLKIRPNFNAFMNRVGALFKLGRVDEGVAELENAIRHQPDEIVWRIGLGQFLAPVEGRLEQAIVHFREAARISPDDPGVRYWLGRYLAEQGDLDDAVAHLAEAIRIRPDAPEPHYEMGRVFARWGKHAEAMSYFSEALRLKPNYPEAGQALDESRRLSVKPPEISPAGKTAAQTLPRA
jgi:protein O-mannosyl-transferase